MRRRRLFWLGVAAGVSVVAVGSLLLVTAGWLLSPVRGRFTEADCERIRPGMTLEEVEGLFGPAIPDERSILVPRSKDRPTFWKAWGDRVSEIHVEFDQEERAQGWVWHPLRPLVIHHIMDR